MAIFLLLNSVGYTVYAHYCDDKLKETSILVNTNNTCCADDEEAPIEENTSEMGCCAEQNLRIKIIDHFVKAEQDFNLSNSPVIYISNSIFYADDTAWNFQHSKYTFVKESGPPDIIFPDRSILFSIFRI